VCLYATVICRLASHRVAAIAALGVAALAFWGTTFLWVSGSQELWMLVFTMLGFLLFIVARPWWALGAFVLALLSKETAGILPALLCAWLLIVGRRKRGQAARQTWPSGPCSARGPPFTPRSACGCLDSRSANPRSSRARPGMRSS